MNDRELLELAAKAYGFGDPEGSFIWTESEYPRGSKTSGALWNYIGWCDTAELWNPLTDDGDALRLAGELGLVVCIMRNAGFTRIYLPACSIGGKYDEVQHHGDNANSATRRAIVRAAAAIGEAMQ